MNNTLNHPTSGTAPIFLFAAAAVFFIVFVIGNALSGHRIAAAVVAGIAAVLWMCFLRTRQPSAAQAGRRTFGILSDEKALEKLLDGRR